MFYHYDGLGSTRGLSNGSGVLTDTYNYTAFGEVHSQTGSTENNYLYAGEQLDTTLNQYYLRARYYNQANGRFTQMDTWMGRNNEPVTLNKYLYGHSDPINHIDPTGNFSLASFSAANNIRATLATTSVPNFSAFISRAVIGTLPTTGRVASTKLALRTLRQCIRKQNKCNMRFNLLIVGFDSPDMIDHVRSAQLSIPRSIVLTYDSRVGGRKGGRQWYRRSGGLPACVGRAPAGQSCDEYPMYKTREGGFANYSAGRVSLKWVSATQNTYVGIQYGVIARAIRSGRVKDRKVVVVTSRHLPSIGIPASK